MAIGSLPTLQISLEIIALFEKINNNERILTVVSNIGEVYITVVSMKSIMWKAQHYAVIWKQFLIAKKF